MSGKKNTGIDKGLLLTFVITAAFLLGVFLLVRGIGRGAVKEAAITAQVLQSGSITEGLAVKTGDQTSMLDRISGRKSYAVEVYYTVNGTEYHLPEKTVLVTAYRVSSDIFDPIDGEDRDGQGPVTVRYDPDDPQSAAVEEFSRK